MTDQLHYQVSDGPLSVRATPGTAGARIGELPTGAVVVVEAASRLVVDGFVWWKHTLGWSAQGSVDGRSPFMVRIREDAVADSSASEPTAYQVTNGPVSIRANPDVASAKLGELPNGTVIEVLPEGRATGGGFNWIRHQHGWSALGKSDGSSLFMTPTVIMPAAPEPVTPPTPVEPAPAPINPPAPVTPPAPTEPADTVRYFVVTDGPISIRQQPDPNSAKLGELANGTVVEIVPDSRTVNAGYVYWQHSRGWSAERRIGGGSAFMIISVAAPPPPAPAVDRTVMPDGTPIQFLEVIEGPISIRAEPTLTSHRLGQLEVGEQFEVVPRSRTENNGYAWWQHSRGWSPERKLGSESAYVVAISSLTRRVVDGVPYLPLMVQHPVPLGDVQWVQYYGNTIFAHKIRSEGKFWYNYCQSLHGGFDYGSSRPTVIVAGVEGVVLDVNINKSTYAPNYTRIKVGPYIFIYGHIANATLFNPGDRVAPNTVVGIMDAGPGRQNHLHLEVRYGMKILNPLEVMTEERQQEITGRFKDFSKHFYRSATWSQWQTPYDQPVLNLQNFGKEIIIGPHAR